MEFRKPREAARAVRTDRKEYQGCLQENAVEGLSEYFGVVVAAHDD
jgi:hypothetical protein